ncbi:DUF4118 domain-containing protein [Sphingomonas sp. CJ99]
MNSARRPDPETLLTLANRAARGRLKIILGAAPGVGKTFEMLREGADLLRQGRDVVIGVVETHGRADTGALTQPFEILPRRTIAHGPHTLHEFDIDAMLLRRPDVALIDEFAHSNAPGSRHPKRWQDVEELRNAGIDVYTTLNIQHVESLNDVVTGFTHVRVRETVPDHLLDDAEIEVVDLPPDELITRLRDGKVYIPEEASRALGHFFSKANLSALRELALRRAAQTVDRQMLDQLRASGDAGLFASGERIVVAVGDQPGSDVLVRTAKRLADAHGAAWTAVSIETPRSATLDAAVQRRMSDALRLAATLGGQVMTIAATDVRSGLLDFLVEQRATMLVIGKTPRSRWFELRHGAVVDRLVRELRGISVHVVPMAETDDAPASPRTATPWRGIVIGMLLVAATTLLGAALHGSIGVAAIDLLYIVPVVAAGTLFGLRPALATAVASGLAYNFFFLPPLYTMTIQEPQNAITFAVLIGVGIVAAQLAGRLRRQANVGARTASENAAIAAFGQRLAAIADEQATAAAVAEEVARLMQVSAIVLAMHDGTLSIIAGDSPGMTMGPVDLAAAEWAFDRGEIAGRDSATLTASDWQFHPLTTSLGTLALLGVSAPHAGPPIPPDRQLLFATLKGQAALAYERIKLERDAREVAALRQRDDLRATLLSSIGHDLKTPLTAIVAAVDTLGQQDEASPTLRLLREETSRLRRFFDDLIEMTRLESGALTPRMEPIDLVDAVAAATHDLRSELAGRALQLDVPVGLPLVDADPRLLHHILINLIGNAAKFSPEGSRITIAGARTPDGVTLSLLDEGPGLPGDPSALFDRFARGEGTDRAGGTGLGLAIVKGFAEVMGLTVSAGNRAGGGAAFGIAWPGALVRKGRG